jgi:CBS domain-containing protein
MDPRTGEQGPDVSNAVFVPDLWRGLGRNNFRVGDVMSKEPVTAMPDETILCVAQKMAEQRVSCVVVLYKDRVVGILTEKDMLDAVAGRDTEMQYVRAAERMSSPVETISPQVSILEADRMMETRCIRRLPVVENGQLIGILTQTDITRALLSLRALCSVADIMTKRVATVDVEATMVEAARLMSCSNISCLVVLHDERIVGILTERDLLKRVIALRRDPNQTRVVDVMSLPVVTISPACSILSASKKMEAMHFHRLLVADEQGICGIITQSDIMRAVRRSSEAAEARQHALEMELADLVQRTIRDLQRVRAFLDEVPGLALVNDVFGEAAAPPAEPAKLDAVPSPQASS